MIPIQKPSAPNVLTTRGQAECDALCADYDQNQQPFPESRFKKSLYAHASVKRLLIASQHGKCCFCEKKVDRTGQVEHYRPKAAVQQSRGAGRQQPGYYWLAYRWENLLLSCSDCNTLHKLNIFPLRDESMRARSHHDEIRNEEPLLLNPAEQDPTEHIGWRGTVAIGLTEYGTETIGILRLNDEAERSDLISARRERLDALYQCWRIVRMAAQFGNDPEARQLIEDAQMKLTKARQDDYPFAAMIRAAIRDEFKDAVTQYQSIR